MRETEHMAKLVCDHVAHRVRQRERRYVRPPQSDNAFRTWMPGHAKRNQVCMRKRDDDVSRHVAQLPQKTVGGEPAAEYCLPDRGAKVVVGDGIVADSARIELKAPSYAPQLAAPVRDCLARRRNSRITRIAEDCNAQHGSARRVLQRGGVNATRIEWVTRAHSDER